MIKGSQLINKPIITFSNGEIVDKVQDLIYDSQSNELLALLIDEGGFLSSARVIPFQAIKAMGPDAITIDSDQAIIKADDHPRTQAILKEYRPVKGLQVMTEDGKDLGKISDLFFNESTGRVEGYEVTGGMFADAYSGRPFLPAPKTLKIGEDVAFVPNDTVQLMEEQVGGLKGVGQNMSQAAKEKSQQLTESAKTKAQELGLKAQYTTAEARDAMAAHAETGKERASELTERARSRWEEQAPTAKQELTDFWQNVKETAAQVKDRASSAIEEQRIKSAVGRPVSRVIFNQEDQIILNTGDLITHQAVEQAREAGVLDVLLDSVYSEKPQLSKDDLRAGVR